MEAGDDGMMIEALKEKFSLLSHPEGGFFSETYRAQTNVKVCDVTRAGEVSRSASTAIYFLITPRDVSRLHRIASDEVWHHYMGDPLIVVELDASAPGHHRSTLLGKDIMHGQTMQHVVKAGTWFGSYPAEFPFERATSSPALASAEPTPLAAATTAETARLSPAIVPQGFCFVGCTVAPGFEFQDFELGTADALNELFPLAREVISKLT